MKHEDDKYYHIYNRGVDRNSLFFSSENYRYCIRLMDKYKKIYRVSVAAFCLMPNHYHFLLRQLPSGSIHRFLQTVFNAYTQAVNKERSRTGTLFEGRAQSREVDSDNYAMQLSIYIHLNPVNAHFVKNPTDWEFSDYKTWIALCQNALTDLSLRNQFFENGLTYMNCIQEAMNVRCDQMLDKYLFDED